MAASPGLEPRLTESESAVLPLDDEAIIDNGFYLSLFNQLVKYFYHKAADFILVFLCTPLSK